MKSREELTNLKKRRAPKFLEFWELVAGATGGLEEELYMNKPKGFDEKAK